MIHIFTCRLFKSGPRRYRWKVTYEGFSLMTLDLNEIFESREILVFRNWC
jgi:hypothetical protein